MIILTHPKQSSYSKDAALTTTYSDDYIVRGDCFNIVTRQTIANGATLKCVFDYTAVADNKFIFKLPLQFSSSGGYFKVNTYKITNYTGGTAKLLTNANYNSTNAPQTVFKYGITSADVAGNDLREYIVGSGTNPGSSRGGAASGANALILNNSTKICVEIINSSGGSADFYMAAVIYEIRAKA